MSSIRHHRDKSPRASAKAGLSPGTLVFIGEQAMHKARIDLIEYDEHRIDEILEPSPDRCCVVDNYFIEVERIGDRVEALDDEILADPKPETLREMHRLKRDILRLRKSVWPLREEIGALNKSESGLIRPGMIGYFRKKKWL